MMGRRLRLPYSLLTRNALTYSSGGRTIRKLNHKRNT